MSASDSIDLTRQKQSSLEVTPKVDFADEIALRSVDSSHKRYGNMLVLYQSDRVLITLGPDYICFLITLVGFVVADYFLIDFVNSAFDKFWIKVFNFVFALFQLLSYIAVGVSNPGIVLQENLPSQETQEGEGQTTIRYCLKCKVRMFKGVRHCRRCDVCVRQFDHHCPWTSKCIGGGNIKRFYFFVSLTPIYIIYFMIMLMISSALIFQQTKLKGK